MWNPFKPKDPVQELNDLIQQSQQLGIDPNQLLPQGGMQVGWPYNSGPSYPGVYTGPGGVQQLTPAQIMKMLGLKGGMSDAEQKELEQLQADHAREVKVARLNQFKKLAPEMRQFVLNMLTWREAVSTMNEVAIVKSDRLQELERNQHVLGSFGGMGGVGQYMGQPYQSMPPGPFAPPETIQIPEGITVEDLKQAHLEASMEEEMLDGQS